MQDVHSHVHGGVSLRRSTPYTLWPLKGQRDVELGILESYSSCTIPVAPFGGWRHHLPPRFAVGLWVLGRGVNLHVEQQRRETVQPGLWLVGNAPLLVLTHHLSPGGGTLLYASLESPTPGETPPQAAEEVHFHRAVGAVCLFSPARQGGSQILPKEAPF